MYDYIRLELTGYVPPAPSSVTTYAGNNSVLLSWPTVAGATSYNILRSTTSGSGYVSITNGVLGPVCGSGPANATFVDNTAANNTTYYYVVQSVNPVNTSGNSPEGAAVTPSAAVSSAVPVTPTGLMVTSTNNAVTFTWNSVPGANYYTVYRGTVVNKLGYVIRYDILSNTTTSPAYTDASGTLGCTYSYYVTATSASGTSGNSSNVTGKPVPPPPATPPANMQISDNITSSSQTATITWSPVSGAVGYILYRANNTNGPFSFPGNYVQSITTTTYTDGSLTTNTLYSYEVVAMNAGGVSGASAIVSTPPPAPASLGATAGNAQILLNWSASASATSYTIKRGLSSGGETALVTGITGTSYTDTNLVNGTAYYYIVTAVGPGGTSQNSPEASATPSSVVIPGLVWTGSTSSAWDATTTNWLNGITPTAYADGDNVLFNNSGASASVVVGSAVLPGSVTFTNSTINYTVSGSSGISGSASLVKTGSGSLTLNNTNYYSGGTIISNGSIIVGSSSPNYAAWGTGPITLMGGTAQLNGYGGNNGTYWGSVTNDLIVPTGQSGTLLCPARIAGSGLSGKLTGGGTLNVSVDYVRGLISGDWSAFTGQINVSPRSGTGDFRINNAYGYANAAIYLNSGVTLDNINASGQMTDIGELGGASGAFIGAGNGASTNPTWRIGAKNTTNTFAGYIGNSGVTSLVKVGTGTLTLSGTNSYSGGTTVSSGILLVNNTNGSATGSGSVTVAGGGTLGGTGIISGAVTVQNSGALAPGTPLGTLTVSNNLTLASGSTTFVQVQHLPLTNDAVKISGTLIEGGTLNVTDLGIGTLTSGDSFKVFNAGVYSGAFTDFVLPPLGSNLAWKTSTLSGSGVISVVPLSPPPAIGTVRIAGSNVVFSGTNAPDAWTYYILSSTNLSLPLTNWTRIATNQTDGNGNYAVTNSVNPNLPQIFLILKFQ